MNILAERADPRFEAVTLTSAKRIILTHEGGRTPEERWEDETAWVAPIIQRAIAQSDGGVWVDFGCGAGRVARALTGPLLGVDNALMMGVNARLYVKRPDFGVVTPTLFHTLAAGGLRCSGAFALWALQHIRDAAGALDLLELSLLPGAELLVLGTERRYLPRPGGGWEDDGVNVLDLLGRRFDFVEPIPLDPAVVAENGRFFHRYRRR